MESVKATPWRVNQAQAARWNKLRARHTRSTELQMQMQMVLLLLSGFQVQSHRDVLLLKTGSVRSKDHHFMMSTTGSGRR